MNKIIKKILIFYQKPTLWLKKAPAATPQTEQQGFSHKNTIWDKQQKTPAATAQTEQQGLQPKT